MEKNRRDQGTKQTAEEVRVSMLDKLHEERKYWTESYRCLRNIYKQRKDHRLPEWREFCKWIETLPYAEELLIN